MSGTGADAPIWQLEGAAKRDGVRSMFSAIAPTYDRLNSLMSFSEHQRWRREAVQGLGLTQGDSALDLCCGTGDFVQALRHAVGAAGTVVGLDFSFPMLDIARHKAGAEAFYLSADALSIPCASHQFDAVTVGWGVRNVGDIDRFHQEVARVLKPGGRYVSIEMAVPGHRVVRKVSRALLGFVLPLIGRMVDEQTAYTYLPESTRRFHNRAEVEASMRGAGLKDVRHSDRMLGNVCIHWGVKA